MSEVLSKFDSGTEVVTKGFPVFLKTEEMDVLIVGARDREVVLLKTLLKNLPQATIRIQAEKIDESIRQLESEFDYVTVEERPYEKKDLENANLVIIAGNQQQLMQRIQLDASQLGLTDVHILQGDAPMNIFANGGVPLNGNTKRKKLSYKKIASYALGVFALMLIGHIIFSFLAL
jgi:Siroheme synthase (precorrin-2 oxidase/ferrochelatase domain)